MLLIASPADGATRLSMRMNDLTNVLSPVWSFLIGFRSIFSLIRPSAWD